MKNRRAILFSILLGGLAVILAGIYQSNLERRLKGSYEEISVLIATKDIARYERIDESMIAFRKIPKLYVAPLAVSKEELEQIIGFHVADATIKKGEQITRTKLSLIGEGGISPIIPPKFRACTVSVNEVTGVGGHIRNRDTVDVITTLKTLDTKSQKANAVKTVTLFQNIPVLAVGRNYLFDRPAELGGSSKSAIASSRDRFGFSNVTLQLTPRQCMDLVVAQQVGEITLALRSYHDRFNAKDEPSLKTKPSTTSSATGIKAPVEISHRPRWLELRGDQPMLVP